MYIHVSVMIHIILSQDLSDLIDLSLFVLVLLYILMLYGFYLSPSICTSSVIVFPSYMSYILQHISYVLYEMYYLNM